MPKTELPCCNVMFNDQMALVECDGMMVLQDWTPQYRCGKCRAFCGSAAHPDCADREAKIKRWLAG